MNRGSAMKWCNALRETTHLFDNFQLAYPDRWSDRWYVSPLGVLCGFLDPEGFQPRSLIDVMLPMDPDCTDERQDYRHVLIHDFEWHGETFILPEEWRKRVKIKTEWLVHEVEGQTLGIYEAVDNMHLHNYNSRQSFDAVAEYVEQHYQQF